MGVTRPPEKIFIPKELNFPSQIKIELTANQRDLAAMVGIKRMNDNINRDLQDTYHSGYLNQWQWHVEGAMAECAVARYFNVFWDGSVGDHSAPDVGIYQVRSVDSAYKRLILHKEDKDDPKYIQVFGINGTYFLLGWMLGSTGKKPEFWEDPKGERPAFFAPHRLLQPIEILQPRRIYYEECEAQ